MRGGLAACLVIAGLAAWSARAQPLGGEPLTIQTTERVVELRRFAAIGDRPAPAILMLHGQGIAGYEAAYNTYGAELAACGLDAYFVAYYSPQDAAIMAAPGAEAHRERYRRRVTDWSRLTAELAGRIAARPGMAGRIGVLGFSNGGIVAAGAAGLSPAISAAVVFYGGLPGGLAHEIHRFPPLLVLHGEQDHVAKLADDQALIAFARGLGATADLALYPGAGHAFDFDPTRADAEPARRRAIAFLAHHLLHPPDDAKDCR
jgi:carboxymethylenebutenolidase